MDAEEGELRMHVPHSAVNSARVYDEAENVKHNLLLGRSKMAVWGAGYIGFSAAVFMARRGVQVTLYDIDGAKVDVINRGEAPYADLETWVGFDFKPLVKMGLIKATTDYSEILKPEYFVHVIGVNTERDGKPWGGALIDVCTRIHRVQSCPFTLIVESTLTPSWCDKIVIPTVDREDAYIVVAPRRDWFTLAGQTCEILARVVGGVTPEATVIGKAILSIVSSNIHTGDHRTVEMVKAVENSFRHLEIAYAYQLALAFPSMDMREVLRLAGTKWNMNTLYPSLGVGGYCINPASKYLIEAAEKPSCLTLPSEALMTEDNMGSIVAQALAGSYDNIALLGLAYKGDLKVHVLSQTIRLSELLRKTVGKVPYVAINDPKYTDGEINAITKRDVIAFPTDLPKFDCIVVCADHTEYRGIVKDLLFRNLQQCKLILDTTGIWSHLRKPFAELGIIYHVVGDAGWLDAI